MFSIVNKQNYDHTSIHLYIILITIVIIFVILSGHTARVKKIFTFIFKNKQLQLSIVGPLWKNKNND